MYKKIHNNLDIEEQTKECLKKVAIKITDFPSINRVLFAYCQLKRNKNL